MTETPKSSLESVLSASPIAIITVDPDGIVERWNPAAEQMFGWTQEQVIGEPYPLAPDSKQDEFLDHLTSANQGDALNGIQTQRQRKDGSYVDVSLWTAPLYVESDISGHVIVIANTTEQKLNEQQLTVLNRIMRHNLRNSLTVIKGNAQNLHDELDDPDHRRAVELILDRAESLAELGEQATDIHEFLQRDVKVQSRCDLGQQVRDSVEEFEDQYPEAVFLVTVKPNNSFGRIGTDRLQSIVEELVENAIVHSQQDNPTIECMVRHSPKERDQIELVVADEGPGIPEQERRSIEAEDETPLVHSTGISLWMIHWIVTEYGGDLSIDKNEPQGSQITVSVPAAEPPRT